MGPFNLRQARISTVIIVLNIAILLCMFARGAFFINGANYLKADGPLYTQSRNVWGVISDTQAPKLNLTEAMLVIDLMHDNASEKEKAALRQEFSRLEDDFRAARARWLDQELPPETRKTLEGEVIAAGEKMLEAVHALFLPALDGGKPDEIHAALAKVEALYRAQQAAIRKLSGVSALSLKQEEEKAAAKLRSHEASSYLILSVSTLLIIGISVLLTLFLLRPLEKATRAIVAISEGKGDVEIGGTAGNGEIPRLWRAVAALKESIARHQRAEKTLEASEQYLATVLNTVADAIISINDRGQIRSFNHAAEKLFGYTAEEVIGRNVSILMPEPYASAHDGYIQSYLDTGRGGVVGLRRELTAQRKGGALFPIDLEVNPTTINGARMFVGSVRDMTERRQAENDRLARERAEAANKAKSEFLANMSHELRTPMHAILSYSQMALKKLEAAGGDEQLKKFVTNIRTSGNRLLSLLNNLLDLSKLEAGKMDISIKAGDLHQAMEHSLSELSPLISGKNLQVRVSGAETAAAAAVAYDRGLMIQVFVNLLSNAIKFSPQEKAIEVSYAADGQSLACSVANSGPPIPEDELDAIFDAFTQSSATKTGAGGTGLGLSICRQIVKAHGGRIWAENRPGGVAFHVELPLLQAGQGEGI